MAKAKPIELLPISESLTGIADALSKSGGNVSDERAHSVDSHLRTVIRLAGYKPRAKDGEKLSVTQLATQARACIDAARDGLSEDRLAEIQSHLHSTHSNLQADVSVKTAPELKEAPEVPDAGAPSDDLATKTVAELTLIAGSKGVTIPAGSKKADILALLKGVTVLFLIAMLTMFTPAAKAFDNFNVTNTVYNTAAWLFQGWPTNTPSTNLTVTSYTTNGASITTNGYYLGQQTGGPLWIKDFSPDGVGFFANWNSLTNEQTIWTVKLVRSWADHVPVVNLPNTNDWEAAPGGITLSWTSTGAGANEWGTNLDPYALGNCTYVGVYFWSNSAFSTTNLNLTNVVFGLQKNVKPRALTGGNF